MEDASAKLNLRDETRRLEELKLMDAVEAADEGCEAKPAKMINVYLPDEDVEKKPAKEENCGKSTESGNVVSTGFKCKACGKVDDTVMVYRKAPKPRIECSLCGKMDHWTPDCPLSRYSDDDDLEEPEGPQFTHPHNVLKVSNVPDDTENHHLFELFGEFNPTNISVFGGFPRIAFVNLSDNEQAEKAIQKLNGFVFKSRTLEVVWFFVKGTPSYHPYC